MSPLVLGLVLASAALHVFWNTLVKQCGDKLSFAWLTTVAGNAVLLPPLLVWQSFFSEAPSALLLPEAWLWAGLSGLLETLYVACLFGAYEAADLSAVYPLSRGAAPLVTLLFAGLLVGDRVNAAQMAGVAVVVAGTLAVGLSAVRRGPGCISRRGVLLALFTGCAIAGYHLADRRAMGITPDALGYLFLMHLFMSLFVTLWAWARRPGWAGLARAWNGHRRQVLLVALCTPLSYFLIVLALQQGNVIQITAARNVGILFSTLTGALVLRERVGRTRALGAVLMVAGLAGLALTGS